MITRIVKLTFQPEKTNDFIQMFELMKNKIAEFEGCNDLKLMKSTSNENIFFTVSEWTSEKHLDAYRNSDFFKTLWDSAKILFAEKPEAWSLTAIK
jgi:quinol monooxygenase YgiN